MQKVHKSLVRQARVSGMGTKTDPSLYSAPSTTVLETIAVTLHINLTPLRSQREDFLPARSRTSALLNLLQVPDAKPQVIPKDVRIPFSCLTPHRWNGGPDRFSSGSWGSHSIPEEASWRTSYFCPPLSPASLPSFTPRELAIVPTHSFRALAQIFCMKVREPQKQ